MALGSFTWKRSKLKSISTFVIKAIVNAAYDVSRQQSDEDSLFEIRQAIARLKEYQSNGEESDADSSDDEEFMAPRCRKHPEAGVLVGVCPLCLTVCLTRLAAVEQASSRVGESSGAASPVAQDNKAGRSKNAPANRGGWGKAASAGAVKAKQQKASAPLAALKEGLPRAASRKGDRSGAGSNVGTTSARNSFSDKGSASGEGSRRFSRVEVVHQYCARSDFKSSLSGHFSKSKSGKSGGVNSGAVEGGASESGGARGVKRSNSSGSASLMAGMLRERSRSSTDSPSRGAARISTSGEEISSRSGSGSGSGSSSGRTAAVPVSCAAYRQSGGNLSWVSRWKFRRPADAQSVTKKLSISALVHPDGVTV